MPRVSLQGSNFSGSDFSHSNLSGGKFHNSNLEGAIFNKAYMMRVKGEQVILHRSTLRDATLTEAILKNSDISYADLRRADLTRGDFSGSSFQGSILKSSDAMRANFESADFTGARLSHGNFTDANFENANLSGVTFGDAIVSNSEFKGADLRGAHLYEAIGLTQKQLDSACGSETTILPEGMTISNCPESQAPEMIVDLMSEPQIEERLVIQDKQMMIFVPSAPREAASVPYYLRSVARTREISAEIAAELVEENMLLDLAMAEIDAALRDLPIDSPTRAKLEKSIVHIANARALNE